MRRTPAFVVTAIALACAIARPACSQDIQGVPGSFIVVRYQCPGDPAGNLASFDCSFTKAMRAEHFVDDSLTDQAMFGAAFTGLYAQWRKDPPEWRKNWDGLGRRVVSRYERRLLGGGVQALAGLAMNTDPRHVDYAGDPRIDHTTHHGGAGARIGHAFVDWAMVPRSTKTATGARLPNLPLLAGALANGFVGRFWYPQPQRTTAASLRRAAGPLETALLGSFYAEFSPELNRALGSIVKRRSKPPAVPGRAGN